MKAKEPHIPFPAGPCKDWKRRRLGRCDRSRNARALAYDRRFHIRIQVGEEHGFLTCRADYSVGPVGERDSVKQRIRLSPRELIFWLPVIQISVGSDLHSGIDRSLRVPDTAAKPISHAIKYPVIFRAARLYSHLTTPNPLAVIGVNGHDPGVIENGVNA
jgi:hypothetical protein